jgi:hypothetical protein
MAQSKKPVINFDGIYLINPETKTFITASGHRLKVQKKKTYGIKPNTKFALKYLSPENVSIHISNLFHKPNNCTDFKFDYRGKDYFLNIPGGYFDCSEVIIKESVRV